MAKFNPGDRVIIGDGSNLHGRIATVSDIRSPGEGLVYVQLSTGSWHLPVSDHELRPGFQTCKDCSGGGYREAFGMAFVCLTCKGAGRINRTGPYKLLDGSWSDEVDRRERILYSTRHTPQRQKRVCVYWTGAHWTVDVFPHRKFDPAQFSEAITEADRLAKSLA